MSRASNRVYTTRHDTWLNERQDPPMIKAAKQVRDQRMTDAIEARNAHMEALDQIVSPDPVILPMIHVQKLVPEAILPSRNYSGDAGYDLFVVEDAYIEPGAVVDVPTGIAIELPRGYWARIVGRSSTIRNRGLLVIEGIIDNGYRGHLFFAVHNLQEKPIVIRAGERLSQLIVHKLYAFPVAEVEILNDSDRSGNGFGSTGT